LTFCYLIASASASVLTYREAIYMPIGGSSDKMSIGEGQNGA